ncbi:chaperonin 10-like protein [Ilyonectria robusta]|uniref:chaperonin 10-like protein n=1 Tax=Ilyonectria robusta TaxID=1079257 RepID=UPI001E8CE704|nr:chaperonin 10-like protein [Ilyonectria robusta]KAH8649541.1 chaperonin 10-like protein [Ilyonectria robusta]
MPSTMKAYQFTHPSKGLEYKEVPVPVPDKNQVLVEIKATGLCHTDCNIASGLDDTFFWKRPIILGHEIAGVVVGIGADVTKFNVGDPVVSIIGIEHPMTFGDVTTTAGIGYDGGFAQYAAIFESKTLRIPEGVTFAQAAVATDAVATAYHAVVVEGQISASSKIAIIGLGGLGLSAAQIASRFGSKVYGIERDNRKYVAAAQAGVYASTVRCSDRFAGAGSTTAAAAKVVEPGGKVVLVGLAQKEATLNTHELVALGVTIKGSAGSSIGEVEKSLQMIANKEIEPLLEEIPFSKIKEGLDRLSQGNVIGRLYADPTKA